MPFKQVPNRNPEPQDLDSELSVLGLDRGSEPKPSSIKVPSQLAESKLASEVDEGLPTRLQQSFINRFLASAFVASLLVLIIGAFAPNFNESVTSVKDSANGIERIEQVTKKTNGNMWLMLFGGGMAAFSLGAAVYNFSPEFTQYFYRRTFDAIGQATGSGLAKVQQSQADSEENHSDVEG